MKTRHGTIRNIRKELEAIGLERADLGKVGFTPGYIILLDGFLQYSGIKRNTDCERR